jgi:hypothetical protein
VVERELAQRCHLSIHCADPCGHCALMVGYALDSSVANTANVPGLNSSED